MTVIGLIKYVFDFAFTSIWHFLGTCILISSVRLISVSQWGNGK